MSTGGGRDEVCGEEGDECALASVDLVRCVSKTQTIASLSVVMERGQGRDRVKHAVPS